MKKVLSILLLFLIGNTYGQEDLTAKMLASYNNKQVQINAADIFDQLANERSNTIELPTKKGVQIFDVSPSTTMDVDFAEKYATIRSFKISLQQDPTVLGRITVTPTKVWVALRDHDGFYTIAPDEGESHVLTKGSHEHTAACGYHDGLAVAQTNKPSDSRIEFTFGSTKQRYRFAVVCTGEFYERNGANDVDVKAAITATVDGLNLIYERELNVELILLDPFLYSNKDTDPFTPDMLPGADARPTQAARAVNMHFNFNTYDIGHCLHTMGVTPDYSSGGVARLRAVCSTQAGETPAKAAGWSSTFTNSGFGWLNLIGHEVGHMFGAEHTFNGIGSSCTDAISETTAFEIGSGTTIMSYNGICDADQNIIGTTDDDYFHIHSLLQMSTFIETSATCGVEINTNNTPPIVNANPCGLEYTIPRQTAYRLRGEAFDADGDPMTFTWEQYDEDGETSTATQGEIGAVAANNTVGPLVRSLAPTSSLTRTIPSMENIMNGLTSSDFEVLSRRDRVISYQLTARDNRASGGAIATSDLVINNVSTGPFTVTNPGTLSTGVASTINWRTNNTNDLCELVNIYLSINNGQSFPFTLAEGVSYDAETFNVNLSTSLTNVNEARIMIECADNDCVTFFTISNAFSISSDCEAPGTFMCDTEPVTADQGDPSLNFDLSTFIGQTINSLSVPINNGSDQAPIVIHDVGGTGCTTSFTTRHEDITFATFEGGTYTFRLSPDNGTRPLMTVFDAEAFDDGNPCASFVGSTAEDTPTGTSWGYFYPVVLEGCKTYKLRVYNIDAPAVSIIETINGPASIVRVDDAADPDYSTTYVAVREDGLIGGVSANSDFTTLAGGIFQIHAVSYKSGGATPPAIVDPATWVGKNLLDLYSEGDCNRLSDQFKPVEVISGCGILNIEAGDQTVCNPATNTYDQTLRITFENPPPGGFIRVNGVQFAIAGSPQLVSLPGLISDGQAVSVSAEFTAQPGCSLFLQNVYTAPESCCPITVDLGDNAIVCTKDILPLDAGSEGTAYQWSLDGSPIAGATSSTYTPTSSGLHSVDVTAPVGCVVTDAVDITINESPTVTLPEDSAICDGEPLDIEGEVSIGDIMWIQDFTDIIAGENTATLTVSVPGTYVLQATTDELCIAMDTIVINELPSPIVDLGEDQQLCADEAPITLDAGLDGTSYVWTRNQAPLTGAGSTISVVESDTYAVSVTNDGGCTTADTVTIEFFNLPQAVLGPDQNICSGGEPIEIFYETVADTYIWFKDGGLFTNQDNPLIVSEAGTYVLEVRNEIGCSVTDTIVVTEVEPPVVDLGENIIGCIGSEVVLSTDLVGTYVWIQAGEGPIGTESEVVVTESGTYTLFVITGSECDGSDMVDVSFEPGPSLDIGDDVSICDGEMTEIVALTDVTTVMWLKDGVEITGQTGTTLPVSEAGEYTAIIEGTSGCVVEDMVSLTVNPNPVVELGDDAGICDGQLLELDTPIEGTSYQWLLNDVEVSTVDNVEISEAGEVTLIVVNEFDCSGSDNIMVTVGDNPTLTVESEYRLCEGSTLQIIAESDATSFEWIVNGTTLTDIDETIAVDEAANISVTATNASNCSTSAMTTVVSSPSPTVELIEDQELCPDDELLISAGNHASYVWSTGDITPSITISNIGTTVVTEQLITVTVTNEDDCTATDEVTITLLPELMPVVTASAAGVCGGNPVTLTVTGGSSFTWLDPTGTLSDIFGSTAVANPTETTTYEVFAANAQCPTSEVSTTVEVEVFEQGDDISAGEDDCAVLGQSIALQATGGLSYQWDSNGPIIGATDIANPEANPVEETVYYVDITDVNGCTYTDSVVICVLEDPLAEFILVSIITPNGDGENEDLYFKGLETFPDNSLTIYNRWGNVVFEKSRYQQDDVRWDGTNGGSPLSADTYYYILTFDGNTYKSDITIMR